MTEFIGKEGEEDLLLVKGFDGRRFNLLSSFDELVSLRHMEDEFVADQFGGSVIDIGALEPDIIRRKRRSHSYSREDHGDTLDMDRHTEDDGVELLAEHADEGRIGGLEVVAKTGTLVGREAELTRVRKD